MKRYEKVGLAAGYSEMRESPDGEWVKAEVAQALHDVVTQCKAMGMLTVGHDSGISHKQLCADATKALSLADGEDE